MRELRLHVLLLTADLDLGFAAAPDPRPPAPAPAPRSAGTARDVSPGRQRLKAGGVGADNRAGRGAGVGPGEPGPALSKSGPRIGPDRTRRSRRCPRLLRSRRCLTRSCSRNRAASQSSMWSKCPATITSRSRAPYSRRFGGIATRPCLSGVISTAPAKNVRAAWRSFRSRVGGTRSCAPPGSAEFGRREDGEAAVERLRHHRTSLELVPEARREDDPPLGVEGVLVLSQEHRLRAPLSPCAPRGKSSPSTTRRHPMPPLPSSTHLPPPATPPGSTATTGTGAHWHHWAPWSIIWDATVEPDLPDATRCCPAKEEAEQIRRAARDAEGIRASLEDVRSASRA